MPGESRIIGDYPQEVDDLRGGGAAGASHHAPLAAAARAVINLIQPEIEEV